MADWNVEPFQNGSSWMRADFHLHTKADKEFKYTGEENSFVNDYVDALKKADIRVGAITNHNKFDVGEYNALRKKAKKNGILLLPGVELSVNDGANGVHTLIIFSQEWIEGGKDLINQFLGNAFKGKTPAEYEQENGRSSLGLRATLEELDTYHKDFFIVFAHVESASGLWNELDGGRLQELANDPLIKKYCLGFQKVRTHDKPDTKCRIKVKGWWGESYPAELEGSDPKAINEIGRGQCAYLKIGELSYESVKYSLNDFQFRVGKEPSKVSHSYIEAIRYEGGLLDKARIPFSPHLNCLIGIRGSGKSSLLESLRYALDIPFGQVAQDRSYKDDLIPHLLQSGGKIVVEARDKHGTLYEIKRIHRHSPEVYVDGVLQPGLAIRQTVVWKPLYFGQKDLAAAGKGFGQDLVEKLVGDSLKPIRQKIQERVDQLETAITALMALNTDVEQKDADEDDLKDVQFRLDQFKKYGVQEKLDKQVEFGKDLAYFGQIIKIGSEWADSINNGIVEAEESVSHIPEYTSQHNSDLLIRFNATFDTLKKIIEEAKLVLLNITSKTEALESIKTELESKKDTLKEAFAETEREIVKALAEKGVTSIQPDEYVTLSNKKTQLEASIKDLKRKTDKYKEKQNAVMIAISSLNEAWHEEYVLITKALEQINTAQSALKVEPQYKGDTEKFASKMDEVFKGQNIRKEYYKNIADKYADFGEIYKDLEAAAEQTKSKADVFIRLFNENLFDLLSFQVPNSYKVTYHGKDLKQHSLGQRASAMMLFILSQKDCDLLMIDQPEDDLDGQSIYEEVVKLIRELKPNQQFIFATHNANFPVLGDAELVVSCQYNEDKITVEGASIDDKESQKKIVNIMEGGREAFERRKVIYQQWEH